MCKKKVICWDKNGDISWDISCQSYNQNLNFIYPVLQCEAPKIAKLVFNSSNYGLWYL